MSDYRATDADGNSLKPGSFYWVKPAYDVDFDLPDIEGREYDDVMFEAMRAHWTQNEQPARFEGYDENGNEKWIYLGHDTDESNWWPICWIGKEISPNPSTPTNAPQPTPAPTRPTAPA